MSHSTGQHAQAFHVLAGLEFSFEALPLRFGGGTVGNVGDDAANGVDFAVGIEEREFLHKIGA